MYTINDSKEENGIVRVCLSSRFGLHPFVYFAAKNIIIILFLCIVPSFWTSSRRLYITSNVYPLYVEVDGESAGITPCNLLLKSGKHNIELFYSNTKLHSANIKVRKAIFLSYIFEYSQKYNVYVNLDDKTKDEINRNFLQDSIDYQTLFRVNSTHIQKPYFSYYKNLLSNEVLGDIVDCAKYNIANSEILQDFEKSFGAVKLDITFPEFDTSLRIKETGIEKLNLKKEEMFGGREFLVFDNIAVSKDEVDANIFRLFLQENKEYSIENKKKLIDMGIVDDDYLDGLDYDVASIRNVSYNVVIKFLEWFSNKYSCKARLLTKKEYVQLYDFKSALRSYNSRLYEFTSTDFITYEALIGARIEHYKRQHIIEQYNKYCVDTNKEIFCMS